MFSLIFNKIKKWKNAKKLRKSNWGREYGWYIEFEGEIIGELINYEFSDMFWDNYTLASNNKKWNSYVYQEKNWLTTAFKFRNKHYNLYAPNAFAGDLKNLKINNQIKMRGLYLSEI